MHLCRQLYEYAEEHGWFQPGHGDLKASLELYSKCQDGRFRREDHTGYKMPAYCTPLEVPYPHAMQAVSIQYPLEQELACCTMAVTC